MRIAVTGGNGQFGATIIANLLKKDYEVILIDRVARPDAGWDPERVTTFILDLNDYEAVEQAMQGSEALIHMGAIPGPKEGNAHGVFANNVVSTYNVLEVAYRLGHQKAVIASSESAYGFPWSNRPLSPLYFPVDELHPMIPNDSYGTSKVANEWTGESFHRRSGMQVVALRLSSLLTPAAYQYFYSMLEKPEVLRRVLWSYVDIRDAAEACVLALEKDGLGYVCLNVAANDTFNSIPTRQLIERFFPEVSDIRAEFKGFEALYDNTKAKSLLGWDVVHLWRDHFK